MKSSVILKKSSIDSDTDSKSLEKALEEQFDQIDDFVNAISKLRKSLIKDNKEKINQDSSKNNAQ